MSITIAGLSLAAWLLFASLPGCTGWSTDPLILGGSEKVYVPYFKNDTFYRRLEHDLTQEVIHRIHERPDLFLTDEKSADLILKGTVTNFRSIVRSEDRQDRAVESSTVVTVQVQVVRASDGKVLREESLTDAAQYNVDSGETLDTARDEVFNTLSRKIVALLEKGF
jgi:hypothetical protein